MTRYNLYTKRQKTLKITHNVFATKESKAHMKTVIT